jgi:hypothetical protein
MQTTTAAAMTTRITLVVILEEEVVAWTRERPLDVCISIFIQLS